MMKNKGHLIVAGASSFIGTRLVEVAIKTGREVTALLRDTAQLSHLNSVLLRTER
jgi:short-subunit dehydrogenase